MVQRTEERFALKPERIAGDVAYGTGEMLGWLVAHDIEPHIPVWDRTEVAAKANFLGTTSAMTKNGTFMSVRVEKN